MLYLLLLEVFLFVELKATLYVENECTSVIGGGCPEGFNDEFDAYCYTSVESTYPYDCPFKHVLPYDFYVGILLSEIDDDVWVNLKRNSQGYYEFTEAGSTYGDYSHDTTQVSQRWDNGQSECIVSNLWTTYPKNCNEASIGICFYDRYDHNFCESIRSICDYDACCQEGCYKCIMCRDQCENVCSKTCSICRQMFMDHPEPTMKIKYDGRSAIAVTVKHKLKLLYMENKKIYVQCLADTQKGYLGHNVHMKIEDYTLVSDGDDLYITFDVGDVGHYWCRAFKYPNLEEITSNTILAGNVDDGRNFFAVRVTVKMRDRYQPYYVLKCVNAAFMALYSNTEYALLRRIISWDRVQDYTFLLYHFVTYDTIDYAFNIVQSMPGDYTSCEVINASIGRTDSCSQHNTTVNGINLEWPDARLGQAVAARTDQVKSDGLPVTRTCSGSFLYGTTWSDVPDVGELVPGSPWTSDLYILLHSNSTSEELNKSLEEMLAGIECVSAVIAYDVYLIAKILETIVHRDEMFNVSIFTENVNSIMAFDRATLALAQRHLNATDIVLYNFDLALSIIADHEEQSSIIVTERILAQVTNVNATDVNGMAIYNVAGELQLASLTSVTDISDVNLTNLVLATFIPPELLRQVQDDSNAALVTAVFTNDALFNARGSKLGNSYIVSVFVPNFHYTVLNDSIPVISKSSRIHNDGNCGHWNYGIDDLWVAIYGDWASDAQFTDFNGFKLCNYDHMTHFAQLVGAPTNDALNVISAIGCVLSMLGTLGIVVTAMVFRTWRDQATTKLLLNFSASIFIQMATLLASGVIDVNKICTLVAITLHFTILSQFCFMLVISYMQYRRIVCSSLETTNLLARSCAFAWLAPILPILIILCVDTDYYRNTMCYISGVGLIYGLLVPIAVVITINLVIFGSIMHSLAGSKTRAFGQNEKMIVEKVRLVIVLFFLMGFSWIFGFIARLPDCLVFSYLFCITATSQGFVIFIYFICCNQVTRGMWMNKLGCSGKSAQKSSVTEKTS